MKSPEIQASSIVNRKTDIVFSSLDDELLAIDAQAGYCYSLNETAGRVWDLISMPVSVGEVCSQLQKEFAVDEELCLREVMFLLQKLHDADLIQVQDA